jgi:hypothetical protein
MPSLLQNNISAAVEAIFALPEPERSKTIALLDAAAATQQRKAVLDKLQAARTSTNPGVVRTIMSAEGILHRGGCPKLETLATKPLKEIDSILAAANLPAESRIAVKNVLHRAGAIPA